MQSSVHRFNSTANVATRRCVSAEPCLTLITWTVIPPRGNRHVSYFLQLKQLLYFQFIAIPFGQHFQIWTAGPLEFYFFASVSLSLKHCMINCCSRAFSALDGYCSERFVFNLFFCFLFFPLFPAFVHACSTPVMLFVRHCNQMKGKYSPTNNNNC